MLGFIFDSDLHLASFVLMMALILDCVWLCVGFISNVFCFVFDMCLFCYWILSVLGWACFRFVFCLVLDLIRICTWHVLVGLLVLFLGCVGLCLVSQWFCDHLPSRPAICVCPGILRNHCFPMILEGFGKPCISIMVFLSRARRCKENTSFSNGFHSPCSNSSLARLCFS